MSTFWYRKEIFYAWLHSSASWELCNNRSALIVIASLYRTWILRQTKIWRRDLPFSMTPKNVLGGAQLTRLRKETKKSISCALFRMFENNLPWNAVTLLWIKRKIIAPFSNWMKWAHSKFCLTLHGWDEDHEEWERMANQIWELE